MLPLSGLASPAKANTVEAVRVWLLLLMMMAAQKATKAEVSVTN